MFWILDVERNTMTVKKWRLMSWAALTLGCAWSAMAQEKLSPKIELATETPSLPTARPVVDRGVLLKDSPFFLEGPVGRRGATPPYEPTAQGFTRRNGPTYGLIGDRTAHRLVYQNNQIVVGDRPMALIQVPLWGFMYGYHGTFPITGVEMKDVLAKGQDKATLGVLRLAVDVGAQRAWLDQFPEVTVTYEAGLARWRCVHPALGVDLTVEIRPNIEARGFIARTQVDKAPAHTKIMHFFGGLGLTISPYSNASNKIEFQGATARLTTPELPRAVAYFGVDRPAETAMAPGVLIPAYVPDVTTHPLPPAFDPKQPADHPMAMMSVPVEAGQTVHAVAVWGADGYDAARAEQIKTSRLKEAALPQPWLDRLWGVWFDNFITRQLEPEGRFRKIMADPAQGWQAAEGFWRERGGRWSFSTPDPKLNAAASWAGQTLEYFRQPPGYMIGYITWLGFGHITNGWNALAAMGDTGQLGWFLSAYAATRLDETTEFVGQKSQKMDGRELQWTFLNFDTAVSEPINASWLDHVWVWWQWTGDKEWLRGLWPTVRAAIEGEKAKRDPDGDGLYNGWYEFWDCDMEQRGPKGAAQTAWMISGLRGAARMAEALGHKDEAACYAAEAERSQAAFNRQLWQPEIGWCGARAADDQRYERASIHEVFIPAQRGALSEKQVVQALRRMKYLYSQTSRYGLPLMFKNDVWPVLWSQHYMPPGDTSLLYMAAAKNGLAEEFYPYFELVAASCFKAAHAGMGLAVGQDGAMDSRESANSDGQAPFAWAAAEGLFGVMPDGEPSRVRLAPNLPESWPTASARIGGLQIELKRAGAERVTLRVADEKKRRVTVEWPTRRPLRKVAVNGRERTDYTIEERVNRALVVLPVQADQPLQIEFEFDRDELKLEAAPREVVSGRAIRLAVSGGRAASVDDPQACLRVGGSKVGLLGRSVSLTPAQEGYHTCFVKLRRGDFAYWAPVSFTVGAAWRIVENYQAAEPYRDGPIRQAWPRLDAARRRLEVQVHNRQPKALKAEFKLRVAGETFKKTLRLDAGSTGVLTAELSPEAWARLLPGSIPFEVSGAGLSQTGRVYSWPRQAAMPQPPPASRIITVDLNHARALNPDQMAKTPMKQDFGAEDKLLGWFNAAFKMRPLPRRFEPLPGLPFTLAGQPETTSGAKMIVLAQNAGEDKQPLPTRVSLPVGRRVERAYVLSVHQYYSIKAYGPMVEWTLRYADGTRQTLPWRPPFEMDSAVSKDSPWSYPVEIGQTTSGHWSLPHYELGPIHAQVMDLPADPTRVLASIEARVVSTETYMGLLGLTLVKVMD